LTPHIYDANDEIKQLLGIMDKGEDHDSMIQVSPALWSSLELT
jgi:hypothetical protein